MTPTESTGAAHVAGHEWRPLDGSRCCECGWKCHDRRCWHASAEKCLEQWQAHVAALKPSEGQTVIDTLEQQCRTVAEQVRDGEWSLGQVTHETYSAAFAEFIRTRERAALAESEGRVAAQTEAKDSAYKERDQLVAALSKLFPASLERHPQNETWEDDWRWIVFIDLPTGQVSWHIHDSELRDFDHLKRFGERSWDGHTTPEKYARLGALKTDALTEQMAGRVAKAREEAMQEAYDTAHATPFRYHAKDDVDFHSGCVQTKEAILDRLRALRLTAPGKGDKITP
jgi:hypothetical protein